MARIVATLENFDVMSSSNAAGSEPLVVGKTLLLVSHSVASSVIAVPLRDVNCNKVVASSDGNAIVTSSDEGNSGTGECLPKLPEGGAPVAVISHRDDLQAEYSSLPVENRFGNQVDTTEKFGSG
jgi:hypothetical protein